MTQYTHLLLPARGIILAVNVHTAYSSYFQSPPQGYLNRCEMPQRGQYRFLFVIDK